MLPSRINAEIKYLSGAAVTLNVDERMQLEHALSTLQTSLTFETIQLWGKIKGKQSCSCLHKHSQKNFWLNQNARLFLN